MYLISYLNENFFRVQSVMEEEIEIVKQTMLKDNENLIFETLTEAQYLVWENNQPKPPQEPTEIEKLRERLATAEQVAYETSITQQELLEILLEMEVI